MKKRMKGQIWIETVIYILIAFSMIGLVLAFARPKIEEYQDRVITQRTIEMMDDIHSEITSIVWGGKGNQRVVEVVIKKGTLEINGLEDKIIFEIKKSRYQYSEPGQIIKIGGLDISTEEEGDLNNMRFVLDYSGTYDIKYDGNNEKFNIEKATTPYKILVSNKGKSEINFKIS